MCALINSLHFNRSRKYSQKIVNNKTTRLNTKFIKFLKNWQHFQEIQFFLCNRKCTNDYRQYDTVRISLEINLTFSTFTIWDLRSPPDTFVFTSFVCFMQKGGRRGEREFTSIKNRIPTIWQVNSTFIVYY